MFSDQELKYEASSDCIRCQTAVDYFRQRTELSICIQIDEDATKYEVDCRMRFKLNCFQIGWSFSTK